MTRGCHVPGGHPSPADSAISSAAAAAGTPAVRRPRGRIASGYVFTALDGGPLSPDYLT